MHTSKVILVSMFTSAITSAAMLVGFIGLPYVVGDRQESKDNIQIPSLIGLTPDQARLLLDPLGLSLIISEQREDNKVEIGHIAQQNPMQGSWVKRGTSIQLVLSKGKTTLQIPGLTGLPIEEAVQKLSQIGLKVGKITREQSESVTEEHVITSVPVAGKAIDPASSVDLVVSEGSKVKVPDVVGKGLRVAKNLLIESGLVVGRVVYGYNEDRRGGIVLRQEPEADSMLDKGSSIRLVVNESD